MSAALTVGSPGLSQAGERDQAPDAAPACYGNTCNGKDPQSTKCSSDAITIASYTVKDARDGTPLAYVEMRLSRKCWAVWTRITNEYGYPSYEGYLVWYSCASIPTRPHRRSSSAHRPAPEPGRVLPPGPGAGPGGRARTGGQRSTSPRMKDSTFLRAVSSSYCTGGDFMK
jgi:hypothetical protein